MKLTVTVLLAVVAVVSAVDVEPVQIVRSDYHQQPDGSYDFGFETANGIVRTETGEVKEALDEENKPHQVVVVRGSYSYTDAEGKPETVNYVADEKGFQPEGDSIPKPVAGR